MVNMKVTSISLADIQKKPMKDPLIYVDVKELNGQGPLLKIQIASVNKTAVTL